MKSCWLNKQNNQNLIVFFAGWSFDANPFKFLDCANSDVLFVYDYNKISKLDEFECFNNYRKKTLVSWSMGVFSSYLLRDVFRDFDLKIAINGTLTPVDNDYGIPVRSFELTLKHACAGLEGKFYKNIFYTPEEFAKYSQTPVLRTIQDRVSELENLYDLIKITSDKEGKFYDKAFVSEYDKIIPPKNQTASHFKNNTPVISLPFGHFPFYHFKKWEDFINADRL